MTATLTRTPVRTRDRWALWGAAAGVLGFVATLGTDERAGGPEDLVVADMLAELDRATFQVGVVAGLLAVGAMLVTAAAWRRWAERTAPDSLAARVLGSALLATASSMILGYGFKGSMAVYLPGGMDEGAYPLDGLYAVYLFLDFAPFIAWWGATVAAAASVWLAFREGLLPRWVGAVGALFAALPVLFMVATGLPGFPGVVGPAWLLVFSIGAYARRSTVQ